MWQAFVTGFAEKASSLIEERNKEIRDEILMQMNQRVKESERVKERWRPLEAKLKETARELESILGNRFGADTKSMVAELLLSGDPDTIIKQVREGQIGVDQIGNFVKLDKTAPARTPEDVIAAMAPRAKAAVPRAQEEETTAFGLPTRVGEQTRKSFMARTGMTEAESAGLELPGMPKPTATFDYDVFRGERKPQDVVTLEAKMADRAVAKGMSVEEYRATDDGMVIQAQIDGRNFLAAQRKGTEEEKSRSTSAIRQNIAVRLRERFQPLELNNVLQWQPDQQGGGTYRVLIPSHPDAKKYQRERIDEIKKYFTGAGLVDKDGKILGGRNAADALDAYADVDYDTLRIKGWRTSPLEGGAPAASEAAKPATPSAAKAKPAAVSESVKASALPIPRTASGEIDVNKLEAGKVYRSKDGSSYRIWNGQGWQPVSPQ